MPLNPRLKYQFESVGGRYAQFRRGYPGEVIERIIQYADLPDDARVLDIGCASGTITEPFIHRGYRVTGRDISPTQIGIAREKFQEDLNAEFEIGSFEEIPLEEGGYNLILSARSWHWIDQESAYAQARNLLETNGTIAIVWDRQEETELHTLQQISQLYNNLSPGVPIEEFAGDIEDTLKRLEDGFCMPVCEKFKERASFTHAEYFGLINTLSAVDELLDAKKKDFNESLREILQSGQDPFVVPYEYVLLMAKIQ